ncbi:hypothetical protein MAR_032509, partial [Mya arenaria]
MLSCSVVDEAEVEYEVVEEGSNRKRQKLVSSDGFSYCVKKETDSSWQWKCSIRHKDMSCYASVNQRGEVFSRGAKEHCHPADPLRKKRVLLTR